MRERKENEEKNKGKGRKMKKKNKGLWFLYGLEDWRVIEESIDGIYLYMRREYLKGKRPGTCKESFSTFPLERERLILALGFWKSLSNPKEGRRGYGFQKDVRVLYGPLNVEPKGIYFGGCLCSLDIRKPGQERNKRTKGSG